MKTLYQRKHETGFAIISAIVLIVVVAALGVAMVTISSSAQVGSAIDLQGARAYQAARSGIEWGSYQVWNSNKTTRNSASCPSLSSVSFTQASAPTLSAFTVTVTCTAKADPANAGGPTLFTITSIACNMPNSATGNCPGAASSIGSLNYVERLVTVTL